MDIDTDDNVLNHMLYALDDEVTEIPLSDILSRENLQKLKSGEYGCKARQIYYFETLGFEQYYFAHYHVKNGVWYDIVYFFDRRNMEDFINDYMIEAESPYAIEDEFFSSIENGYRQYLPIECEDYPLSRAVFNGVEAINQLKENLTPLVRETARMHARAMHREYLERVDSIKEEFSKLRFLHQRVRLSESLFRELAENHNRRFTQSELFRTFLDIDNAFEEDSIAKEKLNGIISNINKVINGHA